MNKPTIEKLIAETLNGNKKAYGELYIIYKKKINLFIVNKFGNGDDRADDVSDILMVLFEKLKKYDSTKSKFDTWVYMIAKNHMIDKSRKMKPLYVAFTSNTFTSDDMIASNGITEVNGNTDMFNMIEPESYGSSPHDRLETSDSLNFISKKIGIENFLMLTMKYNDGYSYNEIAKEFKTNGSRISNKINYSKSKIKKGEE